MNSKKDEIWAWLAGIAGAVVIGLVIVAFIVDFAEGDLGKIWALLVAAGCFGVTPLTWAAEQLGLFADLERKYLDSDDAE